MGRSRTLVTPFLPKIDIRQNRVLLANCTYLVYEIIKYVLNIDQFSLMFSGMIGCIWKNCKHFSWLFVSFYRHKNIISRRVHTIVVKHTVVKTPTLQNSTKIQSNIYIFLYFKPVLNVCYFNYMLLKQIHTHCFNINVICRELRFLENIEVIVFWHEVVISSQWLYCC